MHSYAKSETYPSTVIIISFYQYVLIIINCLMWRIGYILWSDSISKPFLVTVTACYAWFSWTKKIACFFFLLQYPSAPLSPRSGFCLGYYSSSDALHVYYLLAIKNWMKALFLQRPEQIFRRKFFSSSFVMCGVILILTLRPYTSQKKKRQTHKITFKNLSFPVEHF